MTDDKPFDAYAMMEKSRARWRRLFPQYDRAPKLTLAGRCQVYACYLMDTPQAVICRMFGLSRATVSYIEGCRDDNRKSEKLEIAGYSETIGPRRNSDRRMIQRKERYKDVAEEFDRLGEKEFLQVYYPRTMEERAETAFRQLRAEKKVKKVNKWLDGDRR